MAHALGETAPLLMIGMIAFIVDIPQGFTQAAIHGKLGMRSSDTAELHMEDVEVPDANRVGAVDHGGEVEVGPQHRGGSAGRQLRGQMAGGVDRGGQHARLGIAARFVSGYLIQLKPDVKALDGPVGAEADFTDLHAWTEVFLPGGGWIVNGIDPDGALFALTGTR